MHQEKMRCTEAGLNTFEQENVSRYPQGDIMNAVRRGAITKGWNLGLRNPQAKKLAVDMYNGGCVDLHGCVPSGSGTLEGFSCAGGKDSMGPEMKEAYGYLNAPLLEDNFEYKPPDYMMGIKNSGPNSVAGWARAPGGSQVWEVMAEKYRAHLPAPGCG